MLTQIRCRWAFLLLMVVLPWPEPQARWRGVSRTSVNKVCFGVSDLGRACQAHRHGGGARRSWSASDALGKMDEAAPWRSHAEANSGRGDFWLRWQPLHTPMQFLRGCMFNLLRWRPFYLDAPTIQAHLRPSGLGPGAVMNRRCCRSSSAVKKTMDSMAFWIIFVGSSLQECRTHCNFVTCFGHCCKMYCHR